jgi:hypothetical protein
MKWLWGRMCPGDRLVVPLLLALAVALIPLQFCRQPGRSVVARWRGKSCSPHPSILPDKSN